MTPYILHVALILAGCVAFYKILLDKETFFRLNRFVLLACLALSFSLPLIPVPQQYSLRDAAVSPVSPAADPRSEAVEVPAARPSETAQPVTGILPAQTSKISFETLLTGIVWLYWSGVAAFGINFLVQLITLLYRSYTRPVIRDGRFRIVELSGNEAPCSFGTSIFINPEKYDWDTYNQIILHEKVHIREGHSFDLLFAELVLIFQWFNPFAWLYRRELESNLEYLTDQQLLERPDVDQQSYQLSLLKVSAPHFPLSLTTNYNQSLLKKRVNMMNAKKSNISTTWKYLFLVPFLLAFVLLLNKPVSSSAALVEIKKSVSPVDIETEGTWFATIKDNKVSMQFKSDGDDHSTNSNTFLLSEFKDLPLEKNGTFTLTRDPGNIQFTGKFEGQQGMGRYKFTGNKDFAAYLAKEGISDTDEEDLMTYFIVGVSRSYVEMLKSNGYTKLDKDELIPLAALGVDAAFIKSLKDNGYSSIDAKELIPLKALGVDGDYIKEIKKAGYPNITTDQLVTFKAQGISGKYITDYKKYSAGRSSALEDTPPIPDKPGRESGSLKTAREDDAEEIVAFKALNVDAEYVRSLEKAGYGNLSSSNLVAMKAVGVDADFISGIKAMKLEDVTPEEIVALKAQNITPEFVKQIRSLGYEKLEADEVIPLKVLGVTPAFIRSFKDAGFKDIELEQVIALKAQGITSATIQEYQALGFEKVDIEDVIGARVTGTTPAFIKQMREKGHKFSNIEKYITLKTVVD